jgi:RNA polymerase sigma-70 factor (ECF subfamily)
MADPGKPSSSLQDPAGRASPHPPGRAQIPAQLSASAGVNPDVSSVAIHGEALTRLTSGNHHPLTPVACAATTYVSSSDAEVMLRVKAGDDAAFNYLVEKYRRQLVGFMYRMAHNQAVAEELAQEALLRVYRSRQTYKADAKFSTWLYRIATNLAVNHARDTRQERPENSVSLDETDVETGLGVDVADGTPSVEQRLLRVERLKAIRRHVDALPERQRVAVLMHKYQEMDYREIAAVLKLSESATKSLLFRAYETLRDRLKEFV